MEEPEQLRPLEHTVNVTHPYNARDEAIEYQLGRLNDLVNSAVDTIRRAGGQNVTKGPLETFRLNSGSHVLTRTINYDASSKIEIKPPTAASSGIANRMNPRDRTATLADHVATIPPR